MGYTSLQAVRLDPGWPCQTQAGSEQLRHLREVPSHHSLKGLCKEQQECLHIAFIISEHGTCMEPAWLQQETMRSSSVPDLGKESTTASKQTMQ